MRVATWQTIVWPLILIYWRISNYTRTTEPPKMGEEQQYSGKANIVSSPCNKPELIGIEFLCRTTDPHPDDGQRFRLGANSLTTLWTKLLLNWSNQIDAFGFAHRNVARDTLVMTRTPLHFYHPQYISDTSPGECKTASLLYSIYASIITTAH